MSTILRPRLTDMKRTARSLLAVLVLSAAAACNGASESDRPEQSLEGGWRTRVSFGTGPLKGRPYQFLVTYSAGGGMVASSNFDQSPPVAPAYGSWGRIRERTFKNTYMFWTTKPASPGDAARGWTFSGSGVLTEDISLSSNGDTYTSRVSYQLFDAGDQPLAGQTGSGTATGSRIIVG